MKIQILLKMIEANKIYHEDCYETLKQMDSGCVDLMLQDTPFEATQNEWDVAPDLNKMWPEWLRVGKENCAFIFFATNPFAADLIISNKAMFKYDWVWSKNIPTGFLNANKQPLRSHELILVFYKSQPTFNFQKERRRGLGEGRVKYKISSGGKSDNYGDYAEQTKMYEKLSYPKTIQDFNIERNGHPTQKPLKLIRYLILTYSNESDLVFDGYGGSGTTAAACIEERRNFIVCENKKNYFDIGQKRINNLLLAPKLI